MHKAIIREAAATFIERWPVALNGRSICVPDGTTMQLVPTYAHGGKHGVGHAGGSSLVQNPEY